MRKIVINTRYGGFGLSDAAIEQYWVRAKETFDSTYDLEQHLHYNRDDALLISIVEEMGELANGRFAKLKIVEIPEDVKWVIEEYNGSEWIAEKHRTWS